MTKLSKGTKENILFNVLIVALLGIMFQTHILVIVNK